LSSINTHFSIATRLFLIAVVYTGVEIVAVLNVTFLKMYAGVEAYLQLF
jgi:hypothetical protein